MLCGLISDTHNNARNLHQALQRFSQQGVDVILHAGDITSVQTLELLKGYDVWIARGNMDRDPALQLKIRSLFGLGRFLHLHQLVFEGRHIALVHSDLHPDWEKIVNSGQFDYVVFGHTHIAMDKRVGNTRIINPGSLAGHRYKASSYALLDLGNDKLTWFRV
jgi:putative phosphoesterase